MTPRRAGVERVNLNLLVPLEVLLRTCNVTRAGEELHLSQSAMSAVLARLRKTLGDPLLVRNGREMVLTPYAENLRGGVDDVLSRVEQLMTERPTFDPVSDSRTFTVIASDYTTLVLIRPLLETLADEAPGVGLDVQQLRDDFPLRLARDEVDVALISEQLCQEYLPDFPTRLLYTDRFVLCRWAGNTRLSDDSSSEEVLAAPFVKYVTGLRSNLADRALDELGLDRRVELKTESQLLVPYLLTGTPLVAMVPERLVAHAADQAGLAAGEPPVPVPPILEMAVWNPRRSTDPTHQWFLERLAETASRL